MPSATTTSSFSACRPASRMRTPSLTSAGSSAVPVQRHRVHRAGDRVDERRCAGRAREPHGRRGAEHLRPAGQVQLDLVGGRLHDRRALLGLDPGQILSGHARTPSLAYSADNPTQRRAPATSRIRNSVRGSAVLGRHAGTIPPLHRRVPEELRIRAQGRCRAGRPRIRAMRVHLGTDHAGLDFSKHLKAHLEAQGPRGRRPRPHLLRSRSTTTPPSASTPRSA